MRRAWPAVLLLALLTVAAPARATHYQDHVQVQVFAPPRVYEHVRFLAMEEFERTRPPTRMRVGGHTHRLFWNNSLAGTLSTTAGLRAVRRLGQSLGAVFADRPLTAAERRRFRLAAPLYDDADVMVVAAGHPACNGITRAQARSIVAGRITRWSQIVSGAAADAIRVRYRRSAGDADLRFGARYVKRGHRFRPNYPAGSRGSSDAGMEAAAAGDHSVAAVTSWSRFTARPGVCAVPLSGVAPSDASVTDGSYPEAFRVSYVVPRRRVRFGVNRRADRIVQDFMRSAAAKSYLARQGVLVVGGAPPASAPAPGSPQSPAPATDHAGRPITPSPAGGAEQTLTGEVLDGPGGAEGWTRYALQANGTLRRLTFDASGACVGEAGGGWTVKGAWRYPEYGGGLIARLGWFIGDPQDERVIDLPNDEPAVAYLDGIGHARDRDAATTCAAPQP